MQKTLARAGHGSRRAAESLILARRVSVNGQVITTLGTQADPDIDRITVDGIALRLQADAVYFAMNKPYGFLTTLSDPQARRTVQDLLPPSLPPHVFPIGRLDRDTEGLLLFTNDGEFAHRLAHPRYQIDKEYYALVKGSPTREALDVLRGGVMIEGKRTSRAQVDLSPPPSGLTTPDGHRWLRIVIHEGRRRQVRLMCAVVGCPVRTLVRTRVGPVTLARLATGKTRRLDEHELKGLRDLVWLSASSDDAEPHA